MKEIDNHLYNYGAHFVLVAAMLFVLAIPNTVVVALLVAVAMKAIRRPRTVFYATFFWPVFGYLAYWLDVLRLATRAEQLGLPSDIGHLPVDVLFPTRAVCYLLTYSLYTLLVLVIYRYISATRHNTPLNTDAPPNGDAPVS